MDVIRPPDGASPWQQRRACTAGGRVWIVNIAQVKAQIIQLRRIP
jgi:hypothetical protein